MKLCLKTECILHGKPRVKFGGDFKDVAIAFVGESPGRDDEKMGLPLIGEAGKLLREQAAIAGLSEYNCLIANSAMCYLPKDDLKQKEINSILSTCRSHLTKALHITKPKVIVTFGAIAVKQIIKATSLAPIRGTFIWSDEFNCWVFPTYSPSHCLVKPSSLDLLMADFYRLKTFIKDGYTLQQAKEGDIHVEIRESIKDIIASAGGVSYDTETQGLDYINPTNVMISYSIATSPTQAYQVMLHELTTEDDPEAFSIPWEIGKGKKKVWTSLYVKRSSNFDLKLAELRQLFSSPTIKKVMMNGNYDIHHTNALFRNADQSPPELNNYTIDIQLLAHLVNENIYARCSLEQLRKSFTTISSQYDSEFNSEFDKSNMLAVPKADLVKYAGADACVTYAAAKGLVKALQDDPEKDKIQFYLRNMVMPVTSKVLYTLEQNGILVDMHELPGVKKELLNQQEQLYYKLIEAIPECIKEKYRDKRSPEAPLSKTNMIREMLYTKAGLNIPMMKDKKKNSTDSIDKKVRVELKSKKLSKKAAEFIENYDQWTVLNTLLTRYITGIEKSVRVDGKIHSSYSLGVASTGRSNCLSGDTLITVLDDRNKVAIKDIKPGDWVWSIDEDKLTPVPAQVKWQGMTGKKKEVITVTFETQGSKKLKIIKCTPEHPFMLRDGSYVEAGNLRRGDRLISVEIGILERQPGYFSKRMWYTGRKGEIREHQQVMLALYGKLSTPKLHIHHIDNNSLNNTPSNLMFIGGSKELGDYHAALHPVSKETRRKISATLKKGYVEGTIVHSRRYGPDNPVWKPLDKEWCEQILWENAGKPTVFRDKYGMDYECLMRKFKYYGIDFKEIAKHFDGAGERITPERTEEAKKCKTIQEAARLLRVNFYKAKELLKGDNNHVVVSVSTSIEYEDVYDLTIEGSNPNFIANGVCVHNSQNPNLQNLPKRGSLSKIIRKLFISPPGYVFISADASQCLVPETELYTIDGIKTLAEVIENKHPVLSMTSEYDFEFRDVVHGWCTGENEVFEMLLEDGSKVTATANHKFYDYYGNVKRMDELDTGDRLLHVNLNHMQSSYPELSLGLERAKGLGGHTNIRIHRVVGKYLNNNSSIKGMHVHHKDHDINNWHRTNIEICDSNGGHVKSFHSVGKNNPNYGKLKGTSKICPVCGKEFYASSSRKQITCSNTCRFIMFPPWNKKPCNSRICKECGKSFTPSRNIRIFCSRFCSIEASRKRLQGNHRIIRIKSVGFRKTYQIEVDHNHNYVLANGLLSKNCELRWATFLSTEPTMSEIYSSGGDIHGKTAEIIVGKSREEMGEVVYKEARQKAKCFHPDTEVLTPSGWKSMRNLTLSDTLMQAVPVDGEGIKLEWTKPTHCTLELNHTSSLVHLKSENINIKVTPDHRMLVEGSTGKFKVVEPSAFAHARSFWNAGLLKTDASSIEEERIIRLMVATQADGSLGSSFIKFGFYKQRKIERLLSLLREGEYKVAQHKNGKNKPVVAITLQGDLVNRIKALLSEDKTFDWSMLLWSLEDRKVVLDEVKYWDSYAHGNGRFARFSSALKKNCDVLQALCNISLQKAKIFEEHNSRYTTGVMYSLHISPIAKSRGTNGEKFSAFSYTEYPYEEEVAIISVPSSFLLVRGGSSDGTQIPLIVGQCVNFGFLYGAGWRTFQRVAKIDYGLEISDEEAQHIREAFFSSYSALREYHRKIRAFCHQHKYVISPLGRVRHLPEIDSNDSKVVMDTERQALNHAIQSVASDSVLLSALEIMKVSPPEECTPVLFIHDELTFQVREDLIDKYTRIIRHHMVNPPLEQFGVHLSIPLGSDCKVGRNLAEMVDYEIQD